ncbi:MAG: hypothetical protein GXO82_02900 [Chlorobi bacterium]|nr:hypothetical protein [Chlorobiota bacterium]
MLLLSIIPMLVAAPATAHVTTIASVVIAAMHTPLLGLLVANTVTVFINEI